MVRRISADAEPSRVRRPSRLEKFRPLRHSGGVCCWCYTRSGLCRVRRLSHLEPRRDHRCVRARVAARTSPKPSAEELENGIPVFLDQLGDALRLAESSDVVDHDRSVRAPAEHGHDLLRMGLTIAQVVHDYGDVCQVDHRAGRRAGSADRRGRFSDAQSLPRRRHRGAVTRVRASTGARDRGIREPSASASSPTSCATCSTRRCSRSRPSRAAAWRRAAAPALVHSRSLMGLRDLIDRSLADVRLEAGIERLERISVAEFDRRGRDRRLDPGAGARPPLRGRRASIAR